MTPVSFLLRRSAVSLIVAPSLVFSTTLAPEHLHEADDGHHRAAVHRHLHEHSVEADDHDHAQLSEDAQHVIWFDCVALHQAPCQLTPPAEEATEVFQFAPPVTSWAEARDQHFAPTHGPPRVRLFPRPPPSLSA